MEPGGLWDLDFARWLPAIRFLSLLDLFSVWWQFPFDPLQVKLLAGDLRAAQFRVSCQPSA